MPVQIERFDQPLEPLTLPRGGRTLPAMDFTLGMQKLAARVEQGDEEAAFELLRRCLPGITEEEIDNLLPAEAVWVFAYCTRRLKEVTEYVGNAGGAAGPTTAPSAPTTNTSTPSPASPARSGRTGGTSRRNRSAASSSPLTV